MGQKRPRKDKPPLEKLPEYLPPKGTRLSRHDRSNLVIAHDKDLAHAITYSQNAMSILVLGATIVAFLYLILRDIGAGMVIRVVICFPVFSSFVILATRRTFLSWRHHLKAQFIEYELLGVPHTWEKINYELKIKYKLDNLDKENLLDKKLEEFRAERRYYKILHKILKHVP